jgi:hypothetical protein
MSPRVTPNKVMKRTPLTVIFFAYAKKPPVRRVVAYLWR